MPPAASQIDTLLGFLPEVRQERLSGNSHQPPCEVLSGTLKPFARHAPELILKLASSDADFSMGRDGSLSIDRPASLVRLHLPRASYDFGELKHLSFHVEVWLPVDGGPPQFYSTAPLIDNRRFPNHPHLYLRRELTRAGVFANALCIYPPHLDVWQRAGGDLYSLMAIFSLWLAKHAHFERTGHWLGPAASHHPVALQAAQDLQSLSATRPWWAVPGSPSGMGLTRAR